MQTTTDSVMPDSENKESTNKFNTKTSESIAKTI